MSGALIVHFSLVAAMMVIDRQLPHHAPTHELYIVAGHEKGGCEPTVCCNIPALPCPASVLHCNSKSSVLQFTAYVLLCIQT